MEAYIILGAIIFGIGLFGVLSRPGFLRMFIALEIMLAAANLILASLVVFTDAASESYISSGLVFLFFVWLFAIANAAIGLPLFLIIRRNMGADSAEELRNMQG